eukprot:9486058-Pyramimonas_sp.AAC.1
MNDLVDYIVNETKSSKFFLNGWYRLDRAGLEFVVLQAVVVRVSESLLCELQADGRVAKRVDDLLTLLQDEMMWLVHLPLDVYSIIGAVCSMTGDALFDAATRAAHVVVAFCQYRIFDKLREYPFSLALGADDDMMKALSDLKDGPEPFERFANQMWHLLNAGYSVSRLLRVLQGLQNVEWTTVTAEQLHSSAAQLIRRHPEYGVETLIARSSVNTLDKMLPRQTADERRLDKLDRGIAKLQRANPYKGGGRQLFFRDLMEVARKKSWNVKPVDARKKLMSSHAEAWSQKGSAVKR